MTHKRREIRLAEHLDAAREGRAAPVYEWIREVVSAGLEPIMFVLERVPGERSWEEAERRHIAQWRNCDRDQSPWIHPPQTPKSIPVTIQDARLLNVHDGGEINAQEQTPPLWPE